MLNSHEPRCLHRMLICVFIFASLLELNSATTRDLLLIPHLCDSVSCPPEKEMQCPEDSYIRETFNAVDLIKSYAVTSAPIATTERTAYDTSLISNETFAQCCLSKKCLCKTCAIPDCADDKVVVELLPEHMNSPGLCCGAYECLHEPNCTEVRDTSFYWLQLCQRCHCTSGSRICHQVCDETAEDSPPKAICESKALNNYYMDGDTWQDGCYECECVKGEEKCVIPFCGNVNCPTDRQVILKDSCCPVCWPKGEPMPHEKPDDGYGDYGGDAVAKTLPPLLPLPPLPSLPPTTSSTASSVSAELNLNTSPPAGPIGPSPNTTPCQLDERDVPAVVEVVHEPIDSIILHRIIIVGLVLIISGLLIYIRHLNAKNRSYRPVTHIDDKV